MTRWKKIFFLILLIAGNVSFAQAQTHNLNYYLKTAASNSPLLKDYQNRIRNGNIDSLLILARNKPQILANGQVAIYPVINDYGYDEAITNGGNYSGVISVSQPLFNRSILTSQYRQVTIQNLTVSNQSKISQLDLKKNITHQYLVAYTDFLQLQTNNEVYKLLQNQKTILKALVQNGIYQETDYLTFLTTLQSQEIVINQLQLMYKNDLSMLNYLSGINDTTTITLVTPSLNRTHRMEKDSSVFFRQYKLDSLRIQNQKSLLDVRYKPTVSWFADAGLNATKLSQAYHDFGASFGINFSVPVYDGKQRNLKYQQFKIAEETRKDYASFYHHQYNQQFAMLQQQLQGTDKLIQNIREKLKTLQLLINVDQKLLNTGDLHITDYMLAINNYLTIKSNLNQAEISRYMVINQLNYWNH